MTRRRIRAVTFDCWNTLLVDRNLEPAHELRVTALVEAVATRGLAADPGSALAAIRAAHTRHIELWSRGTGNGSPEMATWALEAFGISDPALAPLGVAPDESTHVGDLRPTDVAGGRAFGMATVRLREAFDDLSDLPEADAVADDHRQLIELLLG